MPPCLAAGARPGTGLPCQASDAAASPMTKTFRRLGTERSLSTLTRPAPSDSALSHDAGGPKHRLRVSALVRDNNTLCVNVLALAVQKSFGADPFDLLLCAHRELLGKRR